MLFLYSISKVKEKSVEPAVSASGETENEKDKTTEKSLEVKTNGVEDEAAAVKKEEALEEKPEASADKSTAENSNNETLNESKASEAAEAETSSAKKPKKDKVKRLFSLRSLSFGRKDKQKPKKKDQEAAAAVPVVNGSAAESAETEKVAFLI